MELEGVSHTIHLRDFVFVERLGLSSFMSIGQHCLASPC